ncbi:MAG TPA: CoA transferase, partial [Methylomirabilota bacterium]|nr:CoA transferase [Methylomirabilota bacterium]
EWQAIFTAADVPCTRIRAIPELLADPHAEANGMLATAPHPALGPVRFLGVPVRLAGTPGRPPGPPPELGEHTDQVLLEAGYTEEAIARLRAQRVVR